MPSPYQGKCLCGAISLEARAEPLAVLSCFCKHCSLGAGGPSQVVSQLHVMLVELKRSNLTNHGIRLPSFRLMMYEFQPPPTTALHCSLSTIPQVANLKKRRSAKHAVFRCGRFQQQRKAKRSSLEQRYWIKGMLQAPASLCNSLY
jgi:hypothetical protein